MCIVYMYGNIYIYSMDGNMHICIVCIGICMYV